MKMKYKDIPKYDRLRLAVLEVMNGWNNWDSDTKFRKLRHAVNGNFFNDEDEAVGYEVEDKSDDIPIEKKERPDWLKPYGSV